jgi:hypothetical protein
MCRISSAICQGEDLRGPEVDDEFNLRRLLLKVAHQRRVSMRVGIPLAIG